MVEMKWYKELNVVEMKWYKELNMVEMKSVVERAKRG